MEYVVNQCYDCEMLMRSIQHRRFLISKKRQRSHLRPRHRLPVRHRRKRDGIERIRDTRQHRSLRKKQSIIQPMSRPTFSKLFSKVSNNKKPATSNSKLCSPGEKLFGVRHRKRKSHQAFHGTLKLLKQGKNRLWRIPGLIKILFTKLQPRLRQLMRQNFLLSSIHPELPYPNR